MKVYKNHYCRCGCGKRIPYPTNKKTKNTHKYRGIPKYINGHNSQFNIRFKSHRFKKGNKLGYKKGNVPLCPFKKGEDHPNFIDGFAHERSNAVGRSLDRGYPVPVIFNDPFECCSFHHLTMECGLFVPKEIHNQKVCPHRLDDSESMKRINSLIDAWLDEEMLKHRN